MRWTIALLVLSATPAMAAAPPLCAMAGPTPIAIPDQPGATPARGVGSPALPSAGAATPQPAPIPAALSAMAFAQHVANAGATLMDLGLSHGLHAIAARNVNQFMLFDVTPDGRAASCPGRRLLFRLRQSPESIAVGDITELGEMHGSCTGISCAADCCSGFLCVAGRQTVSLNSECGYLGQALRANRLSRIAWRRPNRGSRRCRTRPGQQERRRYKA